MAVRILSMLAIVAIFYGCGQPISHPEQDAKGDAEPKSVAPADPGEHETTQQETRLQHEFSGSESTSIDHQHVAEEGSSHQEDGSSH